MSDTEDTCTVIVIVSLTKKKTVNKPEGIDEGTIKEEGRH